MVFCSRGALSAALWWFPLKTISVVHHCIFLSCPLLQFYGEDIAATFRGIISICPGAQKPSLQFNFFILLSFVWCDTRAALTHTDVNSQGQSAELISHPYSNDY